MVFCPAWSRSIVSIRMTQSALGGCALFFTLQLSCRSRLRYRTGWFRCASEGGRGDTQKMYKKKFFFFSFWKGAGSPR
ncbi:hypothetical protein F5Y14DRAFT_402299 [Nemania sp. NC0429]|nr:hypothetical protein F5Y14DRAFT_402299 [Nemania sp. NC0429]